MSGDRPAPVETGSARLLRTSCGERFPHPPCSYEKPDDPSKDEDITGQDCDRVGCWETLDTQDPALRDIGETGQCHEVANGSWQQCRHGHSAAQQDQSETEHEAVIAPGAPLKPPDC